MRTWFERDDRFDDNVSETNLLFVKDPKRGT